MAQFLCRADELPEGSMKSFMVGRTRVVAIRSAGTIAVLRDACPHQGVPLSGGRLTGTMLTGGYGEYRLARMGEVVRCPWHAWEFDIHTGCSLHDPEHDRVKAYQVTVVDGAIYVDGLSGAPARAAEVA